MHEQQKPAIHDYQHHLVSSVGEEKYTLGSGGPKPAAGLTQLTAQND